MSENRIEGENIVLVGMPGSGKTTIGKLVAKALGYDFCDMDDLIEEISGQTIPELFAVGEPLFRQWETEACRRLAKFTHTVIAGGGGVVLRAENVALLRQAGRVLFLNRPIESIAADIDTTTRPLLAQGVQRLYVLKQEREALYRAAGEEILNDTSPEETVRRICAILNK
ncbi:shikimate kinase [Luoshenia tenuis]|jgi:shikimate kinase|uniref:shikimate kinase n=1 Tax=Luoshenia tenuis TaxID=2763654 RepID=UPI003D8E6384